MASLGGCILAQLSSLRLATGGINYHSVTELLGTKTGQNWVVRWNNRYMPRRTNIFFCVSCEPFSLLPEPHMMLLSQSEIRPVRIKTELCRKRYQLRGTSKNHLPCCSCVLLTCDFFCQRAAFLASWRSTKGQGIAIHWARPCCRHDLH